MIGRIPETSTAGVGIGASGARTEGGFHAPHPGMGR